MDLFITDALDPEYIIRERLHICLQESVDMDIRATHTSPPAPGGLVCELCHKQMEAKAAKAAREQVSTKKWIVVYEMDDYEPAIHEYDNEKEAREDWDDNKTDRTGHKCIALVMEDEESLRAQQEQP